jgi:hypothetical protein
VIFVGSGPNASTATYAVGDWKGALGPLAPTGTRMTVRITDFYAATTSGKIGHNWMMIDMLDLLRQQGQSPLPLSPLPQGRVSPPQGDSIPAPLAHYARDAATAESARSVVQAMLDAEWVGVSQELTHWRTHDMTWYGPVPFGMAQGGHQYTQHFLAPFHAAFAEQRTLTLDAFACEGQCMRSPPYRAARTVRPHRGVA